MQVVGNIPVAKFYESLLSLCLKGCRRKTLHYIALFPLKKPSHAVEHKCTSFLFSKRSFFSLPFWRQISLFIYLLTGCVFSKHVQPGNFYQMRNSVRNQTLGIFLISPLLSIERLQQLPYVHIPKGPILLKGCLETCLVQRVGSARSLSVTCFPKRWRRTWLVSVKECSAHIALICTKVLLYSLSTAQCFAGNS